MPDAPEEIVRELSKQLLLMIDTEKVLYKNNYEPLYKKVAYKMEEINKIKEIYDLDELPRVNGWKLLRRELRKP